MEQHELMPMRRFEDEQPASSRIKKLALAFLAVFLLGAAGIVVHEFRKSKFAEEWTLPFGAGGERSRDATPRSGKDAFAEPEAGSGRMFSTAEIRWALRESIRIDAMRPLVVTPSGVKKFNEIVNDYNRRAASYRYENWAMAAASADVSALREQIAFNAVTKALAIDRDSRYIKTAASGLIFDTQKLLSSLGFYSERPTGRAGNRTAFAVRSYQIKAKLPQDGRIDAALVERLKRSYTRKFLGGN